MDALLARFGVQAVNYAIRSGIALTSTFAVQQCSRLLETVDDSGLQAELKGLQELLGDRIKIISPAIDLIEFKSGRGNIFLESAVPTARSLRQDIISLGKRLEVAAIVEEEARRAGNPVSPSSKAARHGDLVDIIKSIRSLLNRLDQSVKYLQLAVTSSGEGLSNNLHAGISPSRLLQASAFLTYGDVQFAADPSRSVQIGPAFTLSLYMLFVGHSVIPTRRSNADLTTPVDEPSSARGTTNEPYGFGKGERKPIWQEVIHKARVRICRTPPGWTFDPERGYCPRTSAELAQDKVSNDPPLSSASESYSEFSYHLEFVEDLDDGRLHDEDGCEALPFEDTSRAGMRQSIPIRQISKIFYTDTGRILNVGDAKDGENNPVLLLKRDVAAAPPEIVNPRHGLANGAQHINSADQLAIDQQLHYESMANSRALDDEISPPNSRQYWKIPPHVDLEWMALEVFDDPINDSSDEDEGDEDSLDGSKGKGIEAHTTKLFQRTAETRPSVDPYLISQIKSMSVESPGAASTIRSSTEVVECVQAEEISVSTSFVARSPFGAIVSSLSLMEMLLRLTSLQEFQQGPHLSSGDPVLTFFLEEASTTGLTGEERLKARNEAKARVGFDPYSDNSIAR